ncbi:hypothetical protein roselon_02793 [Roseibacterium elongatum DSM 19469]|uniref:Uncharacterized protein n=1 Tax=Roseicyclus elongatus DSM 19469 TaxID=1294273 RepID=W8S819_9RHOB|nr:hypothetical protein [Roseibacterium elongatum]AHM05091.1 hypothetical protein roselon_02793 [Roseibacterium elongatum DSM 19469]
MTRASLSIFGPVLIWALQFAAVYALISAACAPRGLLEADTMAAIVALLTGLAGIGCLAFLISARRRRRRAEALALAQAAWWSALISLLAVFANAWPIAVLPGCTG